MLTTTIDTIKIFDYERWEKRLPELKASYQNENPYPHIVMDNFLEPEAAEHLLSVFPPIGDHGWIHYMHYNEKKHGLNKIELLPPFVQQVIKELNTPRFLDWVSQLTGIPNLIEDPTMEGGGLHQTARGGFLNLHADFTVHPHHRNWQRRANILIYLNKDWKEEYGGYLELWSRDMKRCVQKVAPIFNRCVIFNTEADTYHGHPDPLNCPPDRTRKSLALYYFTIEKETPYKQPTDYRARPGEGLKSVLVYLDKKLVWTYNWVKGILGINDDFASKVLNFLSRKKK
jgi:hypothetical protein